MVCYSNCGPVSCTVGIDSITGSQLILIAIEQQVEVCIDSTSRPCHRNGINKAQQLFIKWNPDIKNYLILARDLVAPAHPVLAE